MPTATTRSAHWLIVITYIQKGDEKMKTINGVQFDTAKLKSKSDLLAFLKAEGSDDRALTRIRAMYDDEFGDELTWYCPVADISYLGSCIVAVQEGFLNLPYDAVDKKDGELFDLGAARLLDGPNMWFLLESFKAFSNDLISALEGMMLE
jgi:hypothetical protein